MMKKLFAKFKKTKYKKVIMKLPNDKETLLLNLGCGNSFHKDWVNIDFKSYNENVIEYNLNNGIPFEDNSFDFVYSSHVLEHFTKPNADFFIKECYRVLKNNSIMRIVVPDLETMARLYLKKLEEENEHDYDWIMLEMYDQTVRNYSGGEMLEYFKQKNIPNLDFVLQRIGYEGKNIIEAVQNMPSETENNAHTLITAESIGNFRLGGEIHQWMYDSYSLSRLLRKLDFTDIKVKSAYESDFNIFLNYNFDLVNNDIRKPDSLFMEARK